MNKNYQAPKGSKRLSLFYSVSTRSLSKNQNTSLCSTVSCEIPFIVPLLTLPLLWPTAMLATAVWHETVWSSSLQEPCQVLARWRKAAWALSFTKATKVHFLRKLWFWIMNAVSKWWRTSFTRSDKKNLLKKKTSRSWSVKKENWLGRRTVSLRFWIMTRVRRRRSEWSLSRSNIWSSSKLLESSTKKLWSRNWRVWMKPSSKRRVKLMKSTRLFLKWMTGLIPRTVNNLSSRKRNAWISRKPLKTVKTNWKSWAIRANL